MAIADQQVVFLPTVLTQTGILAVALEVILRGDEAGSNPPRLAFLLAIKSRGNLQRLFRETPGKTLSEYCPCGTSHKNHHDHTGQHEKRPPAQTKGAATKRRLYKSPGQYGQHERENDLDKHIETVFGKQTRVRSKVNST